MKTSRPKPRRRAFRILSILTLVLLAAAAAACPFAGRYLIVEQPLRPADAIVVLAGAQVERWLEAVDLYKEKVSPQVFLSGGAIEPAVALLRERGISYPRDAELARNAIIQLGVPAAAVHVIPQALDNTAQEAAVTREIAVAQHWKSVLIVTSKFHTRRSLFAFERAFKGTGIRIDVRASRYDTLQAEGWWKRRPEARWVLLEWLKLVAYRLGLGV